LTWLRYSKQPPQRILIRNRRGFNDFLTRATGTNELSEMTPVQLHAAYTGLSNLDPSETLEEGTNAHNFKKLDYETALGNLNNTLVTNPFADRASVIAQIKQNNPEADDVRPTQS
jgi:hypothetical protein